MEEKFKAYVESLGSCQARHEFALENFEVFVGANFTGSHIEALEDVGRLKLATACDDVEELNTFAFHQLSFGLNSPVPVTRGIVFLWAAVCTIGQAERIDALQEELTRFRIYRIWSLVLLEKSLELKTKLDECVLILDKFFEERKTPSEMVDAPSTSLLTQYQLEKASFELHYFKSTEAALALERAATLAGIKLELGGALGRRTRFQAKSISQLVLVVRLRVLSAYTSIVKQCHIQKFLLGPEEQQSVNGAGADGEEGQCQLPTDCANSDETLLNAVKLDEECDGGTQQRLSDDQLAVVLASVISTTSNRRSFDDLAREQALVYVEEVIHQRRNWAIQLRALLERCSLERDSKRRVERACSQMEVIAKILDGIDDRPHHRDQPKRRLDHLYCSSPIPFWRVKKLQAEILISLGCTSEALTIFESLRMWDEVVACYKRLNQAGKAESLIRRLLDENSNQPLLYCYLGDVTGNAEHYAKAIEISNDRCADARTALGKLSMGSKKYVEAIQHFQRSLELKPLQTSVWFNLGYAAMKHEDHTEAARAFHRLVSFEPDYFEAWNNLAACYVNLHQRPRALKVLKASELQEALKLDNSNEKLWENLLLIAVSVGDWKEAMHAIDAALNLDRRVKIDEMALEMMLAKVLQLPEEEGESLRFRAAQLLARISSRQSVGSKVSKLYAELKRPSDGSSDLAAWSSYIQLLETAIRKEEGELKTDDEETRCQRLANSLQLVDASKGLWQIQQLTPSQVLSQKKLRIRPILVELERYYGEGCRDATSAKLKTLFEHASDLINPQPEG